MCYFEVMNKLSIEERRHVVAALVEGGRILILENGRCTHALQWRDYGEQDPDASGHWYEIQLDPRSFKDTL